MILLLVQDQHTTSRLSKEQAPDDRSPIQIGAGIFTVWANTCDRFLERYRELQPMNEEAPEPILSE